MSLPVVPRTDEDAERIRKRGEKSKQVLFQDLKSKVEEACTKYPEDEYLEETNHFLSSKSFKHFNPKAKLTELVLEVESYIDSLEFEEKCDLILAADKTDEEEY